VTVVEVEAALLAAAAIVAVDNTYLVEADIEAVETDRKYFAVVAVARADYSVVVAQGSPFVTRLSTDSSLWGK